MACKRYDIDSSANAIWLREQRIYSVDWVYTRYVSLHYKEHLTLKILSQNAISNGDISVPIGSEYTDVVKLKGTTYNLEDDKVVTSTFNTKDLNIVTTGLMRYVKVSLPSVKVGSVIDFEMELENAASYSHIPFVFQSNYPVLFCELQIIYPKEVSLYYIATSREKFVDFAEKNPATSGLPLPESYVFQSKSLVATASKTWVRRNIPVLEEEPYVLNPVDLIEGIDFYFFLAGKLKRTWEELNTSLYEEETFYPGLAKLPSSFITNGKRLVNGSQTDEEKARRIFAFVRDSFKCNKIETIAPGTLPDTTWKIKRGSVAGVNFQLVLLLKGAGLKANPVLLSITGNKSASPNVPNLNSFNYMVCRVIVDSVAYFLDASAKENPFGFLDKRCYNGFAWVVDSTGYGLNLEPSELKERNTVVLKTDSNKTGEYTVTVRHTYGPFSASYLRSVWRRDSSSLREEVMDEVRSMSFEPSLKSFEVRNLNAPDSVLSLSYTLSWNWDKDATGLIIKPAFYKMFEKNPFSSPKRTYPIAMGVQTDHIYSMVLKLPDDFEVSELPKSSKVVLSENSYYSYFITYERESNQLILNTKLQLRDTNFDVKDYNSLRSFFDEVIQLQSQSCLVTPKSQ